MAPEPESEVLLHIIREYADHDSWRCGHPPHFYRTGPPMAEGYCACGLVQDLHAAGLHDLADEFDPRKVA